MSDISLPPLPAFEAASEAESRDESDGDDLDDSFDLDEDSSSTSTTEVYYIHVVSLPQQGGPTFKLYIFVHMLRYRWLSTSRHLL